MWGRCGDRSHWQILSNKCCNEYTSTWAGFEHTTLVVMDTDCIGSCKSNYHTITTVLERVMSEDTHFFPIKKISRL
jgi:hypothetical protein